MKKEIFSTISLILGVITLASFIVGTSFEVTRIEESIKEITQMMEDDIYLYGVGAVKKFKDLEGEELRQAIENNPSNRIHLKKAFDNNGIQSKLEKDFGVSTIQKLVDAIY